MVLYHLMPMVQRIAELVFRSGALPNKSPGRIHAFDSFQHTTIHRGPSTRIRRMLRKRLALKTCTLRRICSKSPGRIVS